MIQLLMTSSEHSSIGLEAHKFGHRHLGDAHTLIRVLCHKKEREASKFLKLHYHLPASSGAPFLILLVFYGFPKCQYEALSD